jgi:hypothetical protein
MGFTAEAADGDEISSEADLISGVQADVGAEERHLRIGNIHLLDGERKRKTEEGNGGRKPRR